jgi:hypothetical protein
LFNMKTIKNLLLIGGLLAVCNPSYIYAQKTGPKETPAPTLPAAAVSAGERSQNPDLGATAFGLGTGIYGNYGFLGGALQIGVTDWLRLSGGISGSLPGDQPAGNFAMSNYAFLWHFTGGLMLMGKAYRGFLRPYTMLDLTYFYAAREKAGGVNGGIRIGIDIYMAQDWGIYVETGVNLPFTRDALAPQLVGGVVGIGARSFF